jgi:hypothetical protein
MPATDGTRAGGHVPTATGTSSDRPRNGSAGTGSLPLVVTRDRRVPPLDLALAPAECKPGAAFLVADRTGADMARARSVKDRALPKL